MNWRRLSFERGEFIEWGIVSLKRSKSLVLHHSLLSSMHMATSRGPPDPQQRLATYLSTLSPASRQARACAVSDWPVGVAVWARWLPSLPLAAWRCLVSLGLLLPLCPFLHRLPFAPFTRTLPLPIAHTTVQYTWVASIRN